MSGDENVYQYHTPTHCTVDRIVIRDHPRLNLGNSGSIVDILEHVAFIFAHCRRALTSAIMFSTFDNVDLDNLFIHDPSYSSLCCTEVGSGSMAQLIFSFSMEIHDQKRTNL